MSTVSYKVGAKECSFESRLQLKGISLLAVEQNLIEEIKNDMHKCKLSNYGPMCEITIVDDNGITAVAEDFSKVGTLKIIEK